MIELLWQNVEKGSKILREVDMQEYMYYVSPKPSK